IFDLVSDPFLSLFLCYLPVSHSFYLLFFFFNHTSTTEIYTLSLHDALPISVDKQASHFVHIPGLSYSGVKSPTECQQSLFESHFASRQSLSDCPVAF